MFQDSQQTPFGAAKCTIIAEIAQAHDGSLGTAHAYIDAAANAGADAIKFQTHIAAAESTPQEPWRVRFSQQDASRYDYWRRMEFTEQQWAGLRNHARERGLQFISSPFSVEAAELLERIGLDAWKIASGELHNPLLAEAVIRSRRPVYISTGMSTLAEVDRGLELFRRARVPFCLMQCTSAYPCPPERVGLNVMQIYRETFHCPVGLSDHSGTIYAGLAAAALGANAIEVHIVFSRETFGPDVPVSITTSELRLLTEGVRFIERMRAHPVDKDAEAGQMTSMRRTFGKSLIAKRELQPGEELSEDAVTAKKPGTGIPVDRLPELVGRRLRRAVAAGAFLREEDLDSE